MDRRKSWHDEEKREHRKTNLCGTAFRSISGREEAEKADAAKTGVVDVLDGHWKAVNHHLAEVVCRVLLGEMDEGKRGQSFLFAECNFPNKVVLPHTRQLKRGNAMDAVLNTLSPSAGSPPPELIGRSELIDTLSRYGMALT
ncbi:MAG: hypothetical protein MJ138_03600 [Kiritimatiellae bacterium]|nr:hypothetical protein [Kiritimatiellia bacterium]